MKKTKIFKFLSIFLTKEVFRKYIKLICKMKLQVNELQKEAVAGGYSVNKVFLKNSQNSPEMSNKTKIDQ